MLKIHPDAVPLMSIGRQKQVGWRLENLQFSFDAFETEEGTVSVYLVVGDDIYGDRSSHQTWDDAKLWLEEQLKSIK